jgi:phosphoribosylpyrophosphate synthetase
MNVVTDYLYEAVHTPELRRTVRSIVKLLKERNLTNKFGSIAFRGMSGACVAPTVALRLNKNLMMVRKKTDPKKPFNNDSHSIHMVEGNLKKDYIIIDDFMESGKTIREIKKQIENEAEIRYMYPNLVGIVFYNHSNKKFRLNDLARKHNCWLLRTDGYFIDRSNMAVSA